MFFSAVLHSFTVCGDRDLETPLHGNFHPVRRNHAFPHPFPPGLHWNGTRICVYIRSPCFLDLWGCVNFFLTLSGENSPFSRSAAAPLHRCSPLCRAGLASSQVGCDGILGTALFFVFSPPPIHTEAHTTRHIAGLKPFPPSL